MKRSLLTAFWILLFAGAFAQPGILDQTFGLGGTAISTPWNIRGSAILQQNNGKTILALLCDNMNNNWLEGTDVRRLNIDGSLDTSFHFDSSKNLFNYIATYEFSTNPNVNRVGYLIYQMALQTDQKFWAIVHSYIENGQNGPFEIRKHYLCRFSANGKCELITPLPNSSFIGTSSIFGLTNIIVRPDGNILFGKVGNSLGNSLLKDLWLYQYKPNGTLDPSFGIYGKVVVNNAVSDWNLNYNVNPLFYGISLDKHNRIFIGSAKYDTLNFIETITFMRFSPNGNFDTSYGLHGYAQANFAPAHFVFDAMALTQENNGLIVGHFRETNSWNIKVVGLVCFDSSGVLNNNFGNGGKVFATFDSVDNRVNALHIQKDGKIVFTGFVVGNRQRLLIAKYNSNGTPDSFFGKNGVLRAQITYADASFASLIQPDGKILLAGKGGYYNINLGPTIYRFDSVARIYYNNLTASTFFDSNANGIKDTNESFFPLGDLVTTKAGIDTIHSIFNVDKITLDIDTGNYVSRFIPYLPYYNITPTTHSTSNSTYFNTDSVTFALIPIPGQRDVSVQLIPLSPTRAGFQNNFQITYENQGTDTITNGTIQLIKSNKLNFDSATPNPTSVMGDTLRWNISNLKPLEAGSIIMNFTVKTPPLVNIGDTIQSIVTITSNKPDLTPADNTSTVKQIVRGSFDPNDKTENHGGRITTVQVANGEYLQYTIRFQNTGNDTAFNVYIRDTLDNKLDWSTMQILTASHSYQMTMNDGNKCLFTLRNINLVDSTTNEPGSHGYIVYKVKPKPTVVIGDTIKNTAAIYFDYNLPVLTNTETTTIVNEVLPLRLLSFTARKKYSSLSPGEGRGEVLLNWTTTNEINVDHFEIERSNNGREFSKIGIVSSQLSAGSIHKYSYTDNSPFTAHHSLFYRLKMIDKDGKFEYSPIRMISNNADGQIIIYPNPARDMVTVTHPSTNSIAQLLLTDLTGRILRRTTVATSAVQTNMNIKGLPAGKYNLSWSNGLINHTQALVID